MPYLGQVEIFGKNPGAATQTRAEVTTTNQLPLKGENRWPLYWERNELKK